MVQDYFKADSDLKDTEDPKSNVHDKDMQQPQSVEYFDLESDGDTPKTDARVNCEEIDVDGFQLFSDVREIAAEAVEDFEDVTETTHEQSSVDKLMGNATDIPKSN